jgi:hypothetical protein
VHWCHGATGVIQLLVAVYALTKQEAYLKVLKARKKLASLKCLKKRFCEENLLKILDKSEKELNDRKMH